MTVAVHRLPPAVKIPGELFKFCREEWVAPMMGRLGLLRFGVGRLRGMRGWKAHPDSELGDMLDVLRGEVQVKRGLWEWVP